MGKKGKYLKIWRSRKYGKVLKSWSNKANIQA